MTAVQVMFYAPTPRNLI